MASTLLLGRADIAELLAVGACLAAVEAAFSAHVTGQTLPSAILGVPAVNAGLHVNAAGLVMSRPYFEAKTNAPGLGRGETIDLGH